LDAISKDPSNVNPKLKALKEQILNAYRKNPDLRCILFCKTREMTVALSTWINEELGVVKSSHLTGTNSGSDNAGNEKNPNSFF
jgi:ATP-dependent RNA helicase DDX58